MYSIINVIGMIVLFKLIYWGGRYYIQIVFFIKYYESIYCFKLNNIEIRFLKY